MKHCALEGLDGVHQQTGFLRPECLQCSLTTDFYTTKRRKAWWREGHLQRGDLGLGHKAWQRRSAEMGLDIIRIQSAFSRENSWHPGLKDLSWGSCMTFLALLSLDHQVPVGTNRLPPPPTHFQTPLGYCISLGVNHKWTAMGNVRNDVMGELKASGRDLRLSTALTSITLQVEVGTNGHEQRTLKVQVKCQGQIWN